MYPANIRNKLALIFCLMLFVCPVQLFGQKTKAQLENEKRENMRKIVEAEKILSETESQKKITIGQLSAINQQIKARESLIQSLNEEVSLLDLEINELSIVIRSLQSDLKNLKEEYAAMIYSSYKVNQGFSLLTFLFSSQTFNQLFMRLKYLEQYSKVRKIQAEQIVEVTKELDKQKRIISAKLEEQKKLLNQQLQENRKLGNLKNLKSSVVSGLSKKQKDIRLEMTERKKAIDRLDRLIAEIIAKEIERSKTMSASATEEGANLTLAFEQKKNQMIWPVSPGFISQSFGKQPHPVLKGIVVDNTGIDIQTNVGAEVKSVFDGEVTVKAFVPGYNNVVIIRHGNYYTVYSKLKEVGVKKGQIVKTSDVIGKVMTNAEGISEVHFEIYKDKQRMDPEKWLLK